MSKRLKHSIEQGKRALMSLTISSLGLGLASNAIAVNKLDGAYQWQFQSGAPWPFGYQQSTGKPDDLIYARDEYPRDFFDRIANALPESKVNEAFMTDDSGSNITLKEEGEVFITFIHEGAGYKNSFGYFTFDANNPPQSIEDVQETIVFPNLSYPHLTNGHRVSLGTFPAGTSIGFFIAANGFWYDTGVKPFKVPYYYSIQNLNPDPEGLKQHNVLLYDNEVEEVIIGFEDLPRSWGDNDFNDAVFSVKATPASALETTTLTQIPDANDSDADGVLDTDDEFPNNHKRAFSSYFPSSEGRMVLAFEDNWPATGDYDMNDLVISKRIQTIYGADNRVSGLRLEGLIQARGASYNNGFAVRLMDLPPELLESASLELDGQNFAKRAEANQRDLVIPLWNNAHRFTETGESGACQHFNTLKNCSEFAPVSFTLDLDFSYSLDQLSVGDLDFFIFRTDYRGREIHLADYPPTDLFDVTQFGKVEDTSEPQSGRYFRNENNLPWAIMIPEDWRHPREYIDVNWAYPEYEGWVESSGEENQDWYRTSERDTHYY